MRAKTISTNHILLLYISIYLVITLVRQEYVVLPNLVQLDIIGEETKARLIEHFYRTRWMGYLAGPILLIARLSLVSLCIYLGTFFFPFMNGSKYGDCWEIAVKAQMVLILYSVIVCSISVIYSEETSIEAMKYCSLLFLGNEDLEQWIKVPLSALNIFEIAYWIVMSLFIKNYAGVKFGQSFKYVISTYGVGYLFYIAFVMFLLLYLM